MGGKLGNCSTQRIMIYTLRSHLKTPTYWNCISYQKMAFSTVPSQLSFVTPEAYSMCDVIY